MFSENASSILWLTGCILTLVLAGILLSGISRKQIGIFEGNEALAKEVQDAGKISNGLRMELDVLRERLDYQTERATFSATRLAAERSLHSSLRSNISHLEDERSSLKEEIPELQSDYTTFLKTNLAAVRRKAAGEKIGRLYLKNGRLLEGVVILRVAKDGLDVQHTGGKLRISPEELPNSFQERFQWDED